MVTDDDVMVNVPDLWTELCVSCIQGVQSSDPVVVVYLHDDRQFLVF